MAALLRYLPLIVAVVLLVAAVVDIVRIEPHRVRALPKPLWAVIAIGIVIIGPILWFALGREPLHPRPAKPVAPDDDPEFLQRLAREKEQEQRIRDLEKKLSELDGDDDTPKNPQ
ncbi:PLDc N-terminal domain-containing protein [Protaetiibacter sp. SSC-01]|uniref:PLDc N-terminal domain-containing protein n=1 Tax=Protaetiibacter sp. SSC-01 TaxID=2759943 RepID=UPI001656C2F7|nr:PLDc N-terminal domain-containing protein [Protaetiibacter sp. SSC-01]QNO37252.1 PLDc N-terminal domain-containing protein [Protaetiibacter sp. SSC-01]